MKPFYPRTLDLSKLLIKKSFFLFGPRSTGKTTLIKQSFPEAINFDLLKASDYQALLKRPEILEESRAQNRIIVIDEVQRIPDILNEVHRLIQEYDQRFLLTGSSARKLRRGSANMLAGRAWRADLFPLTSHEIVNFDLLRYLNVGGLPQIYDSEDSEEELESYIGTYLREEIQAEATTRNVQAFAEFLDLVALHNGSEINYESFASDCRVSASTVKAYFGILEDTLLGFTLPGYVKTIRRKATSRAKHYLFDTGVARFLSRQSTIQSGGPTFGVAFEHFIILEIRAFISYFRKKCSLYYWRSQSQFEVDVVIDDEVAIEIKATDLAQDKHLKGLRALKEEKIHKRFMVVSRDLRRRTTADGIEIWPWQEFLTELWSEKIPVSR